MKPESLDNYRPITLDDLKTAQHGQVFVYALHRDSDGSFSRVRVSGKPQTWKTRPNECVVPYKRGLYEHGYIDHHEVIAQRWYVRKEK